MNLKYTSNVLNAAVNMGYNDIGCEGELQSRVLDQTKETRVCTSHTDNECILYTDNATECKYHSAYKPAERPDVCVVGVCSESV